MQRRPGAERLKSTDTIISDWILWYLESKKDMLKLSMIKLYERHINNYIKPFFKNISLKKLNKEILQAFVNSMSDMSPSTVKSVFSFVREALKEAHKKNYILPIWIDVELPKLKKNKIEVFTKEEQHLIENVLDIEETPNDIGILICLYTGLRIGEVCGLKWEDIDFISNYLTVNLLLER